MKNQTTFAFLDALRIAAALTVFLSHCAQFWNPRISDAIAPFAHHAVVVFFVLSGYVIAFSTLGRPSVTARTYASARLSRLYSVVLPALMVTAILQAVGLRWMPGEYAAMSRGHDLVRYCLALFYLQNVWGISAAPPTNSPLWSLSYEAWYYVAFGAVVFARSKLTRVALLGAIALVVGPAIILLAPAWLMGALLYTKRDRLAQMNLRSAPLCVLAICITTGVYRLAPDLPFRLGHAWLYYSSSFLSDWALAAAVGLLILAIDNSHLSCSEGLRRRMRLVGDYTFPIYLFHFPIIFFITSVTKFTPHSLPAAIGTGAVILTAVVALSALTESMRPWFRAQIDRLVVGG